MSFQLVLGAGIISFLLFYFAKELDKKEHFALRLIFFGLGLLMLIPLSKGIIDSGSVCENVLNSTLENYVYGDNYTSYHWDYTYSNPNPNADVNLFHKNTTYNYDYICYDITDSSTGATVYKITSWIMRLYLAYVLYYFVFWLFTNGILNKIVRKFQSMRNRKK